ncbi:MAG: DUF45 domain-containing protein [Clostridia bacterium]|nr:DUF45 domain-containing protein [Clostridia bacterium]
MKNINLRIKGDGSVHVSANRRTPLDAIEDFMHKKAHLILKAIDNCQKSELKEYFTEDDLKRFILLSCERVYPYYAEKGIAKPEVKFRKMVSKWGCCNITKKTITFSTNLKFAPAECVMYVIWHEFTHLLVPNHSKAFYLELEKVCPDWKGCRQKMKGIKI